MGSNVSVKIDFDHIPNVIRVLEEQEDNISKQFANEVRSRAKEIVPVLTGALKISIHVEHDGLSSYQVVADSREGGAKRAYAHYVEYGTSKMHAQPYMSPAYELALRVKLPVIAAGLGLRINAAASRGI